MGINHERVFFYIVLTISYVFSFYFLTFVIKKLPLTVVHASWAGLGVFTVALFSYIFYKQT